MSAATDEDDGLSWDDGGPGDLRPPGPPLLAREWLVPAAASIWLVAAAAVPAAVSAALKRLPAPAALKVLASRWPEAAPLRTLLALTAAAQAATCWLIFRRKRLALTRFCRRLLRCLRLKPDRLPHVARYSRLFSGLASAASVLVAAAPPAAAAAAGRTLPAVLSVGVNLHRLNIILIGPVTDSSCLRMGRILLITVLKAATICAALVELRPLTTPVDYGMLARFGDWLWVLATAALWMTLCDDLPEQEQEPLLPERRPPHYSSLSDTEYSLELKKSAS